jgi:hypothetical protein
MPNLDPQTAPVPPPENGHHTRQRLSELLVRIASDTAQERIRIGDLMALLKDRAFGALMFIFALPTVFPAPPGFSSIVGAPLIFLSLQLTLGRKAPWLPALIANRSVSQKDFATVVFKCLPWLQKVERLLKPRWVRLATPPAEQVLAGMCLLLATIVFLPIPLGNMLPSFAVCLLSLAIIERDGVLAVIGLVTAIVSIVIVWAFIYAVLYALFKSGWYLLTSALN